MRMKIAKIVDMGYVAFIRGKYFAVYAAYTGSRKNISAVDLRAQSCVLLRMLACSSDERDASYAYGRSDGNG